MNIPGVLNRITKTPQTIIHLLFLFLFTFPLFLQAQHYPVRHYTTRDGLPSLAVRCIYKDSRGLIWIGTDVGVCTFDGKSFHIIKHPEVISTTQVWSIAEDEYGNMWFGSFGDGLYKYDGRKFEHFTHKNGLADDNIRKLCYSKNFHCLIAGSDKGVSTIRENKIDCSLKEFVNNRGFHYVTDIFDVGKFIYITTYGSNNPLCYYPDRNKFISVNDGGRHYPEYSFSGFLSSKKDTIFSMKDVGMRIYKNQGAVQNDSLGRVVGITEDRRGDLWICGWSFPDRTLKGGIFRYDGKTFRNYKEAFGITDMEIWSVYYDKEQDILWIGTLNEGLFIVPFTAFTNFPSSYFNSRELKINDMYCDSNNILWIASNNGLIRKEPNGEFSYLDNHEMVLAFRQIWDSRTIKDFPQINMTGEQVRAMKAFQLPDFEKQTAFINYRICKESENSILFTNRLGIFSYNDQRRKLRFMYPGIYLSEIAIMGHDTIISTGWAPTELIPGFKNGKFHKKKAIYLTNEGFPKDINRLVRHGNQFWYTSWVSGLWMSEGMHLTHFNETDTTISRDLNDVCFDEKGHVIFGSNNGEICIASFNNKKLKIEYRINNNKGLRGNTISWLVADQKGNLWVGTNLGLNYVDLSNLYKTGNYIIRFIDEEDGYTGQISRKAVVDNNGDLWIGADNHLIRMDTKAVLSSHLYVNKIILKGLDINGILSDSLLKQNSKFWTSQPPGMFSLDHSNNNLIFNYDILNYYDPGKDQFRYKLIGYDNQWNEGSTGRRAIYTNLPPGDYTFYVVSYNLRTRAYAKPLIVKFTILNPWWRLWYIQLMGIFLCAAIIISALRKYIESIKNRQEKKAEVEKKIAQLEMQALQAQMNPHFIFNCVNGIQFYVLANKMDDVLAYMSDFSKVVRASLENATRRMVPLEQEIDFLVSYLRLEKMRFPDKFDFKISGFERGNTNLVQIPPMLVQPYVENSIRHGFMHMTAKGHLSIVYEMIDKDLIKCTVTDNGVGRDKARAIEGAPKEVNRPHSSDITETRIRLFNPPGSPEKYKVVYTDLADQGRPCGLKVELYLPMEGSGAAAEI